MRDLEAGRFGGREIWKPGFFSYSTQYEYDCMSIQYLLYTVQYIYTIQYLQYTEKGGLTKSDKGDLEAGTSSHTAHRGAWRVGRQRVYSAQHEYTLWVYTIQYLQHTEERGGWVGNECTVHSMSIHHGYTVSTVHRGAGSSINTIYITQRSVEGELPMNGKGGAGHWPFKMELNPKPGASSCCKHGQHHLS